MPAFSCECRGRQRLDRDAGADLSHRMRTKKRRLAAVSFRAPGWERRYADHCAAVAGNFLS